MTRPPEPDSAADASGARRRYRVCVVGSGMRFVSGLSHYTYFLSRSLTGEHDVSVILERNLVPRFLYPGKSRVGTEISSLATAEFAPTFDGLDWYGIPSLWQATRFLRRQRPEVLVLEWWSAACLPGYLALSRYAKKLDTPMVLELHEDLYPAEAKVPVLGPAGA